jgi:PBSX family phage terminase large subunit
VLYTEGKGLLEIWGRQIHVIGAHDTRAEGKIRGSTFVGAYVDEASLIPESAWIVLVQRCAMGGAKIFATTNPDSPAHWMKVKVLDGNTDVKSFHFTMLDNPALTQQEREYLERQHKGIFYRRFVLGEWCLAEGAVFDFFDETIHVIPRQPANAKYYIVGVDIGFTNPTAFVMIGYNPDVSPCLWVEREYYWDNKGKSQPKTSAEFANDFVKFCEQRENVKFAYVDPSATAFKVELKRWGTTVPIRDADNDVLEGIRTLSNHMANGDLKIHAGCRNLIGEMQSYSWDSKASEKGWDEPIKKFDHAIDAMRYGIFTHFGHKLDIRERPIHEEKARNLNYQNAPRLRYPGGKF